jgi:nucleotide-binding universal stress UspA family protein
MRKGEFLLRRSLILAVVTGQGYDRAVLDASLDLARLAAGHIEVLHPAVDPLTAIPLMGEPMSAGLIAEMMQSLTQDCRRYQEKARNDFEAWCREQSLVGADSPASQCDGLLPTVNWVNAVGPPGDLVVAHGRLADVIVTGRSANSTDPVADDLVNAALFESGRPVLCVSSPTRPDLLANPTILWNGSSQAGRAVADAMNILAHAESVNVLSIADDGLIPDVDSLVEALGRRGIQAKRHAVPPGDAPDGKRLFAAAVSLGSSLVIMGGYGHSRLREMVMGGVTQHALAQSDLPLFIAH